MIVLGFAQTMMFMMMMMMMMMMMTMMMRVAAVVVIDTVVAGNDAENNETDTPWFQMILVCFTFYQGFLFGAEDSRGSAKKLQASTSAAVFSANVSALCQTSKARPHQFEHFCLVWG